MTGKAIERRLHSLRDATIAEHHLRFFKCGPGQYGEGDAFLGIMVPMMRALSKEFTPIPVAEAVAQLRHENIVQTYETGVTNKGEPYIIMEWIDGVGMNFLIETKNKQLPPNAFNYLLQMSEAVIHFLKLVEIDQHD